MTLLTLPALPSLAVLPSLPMLPELLPIAGGAALGALAALAWRRAHRWTYLAALLALALCATLASGEYRESWGFLLADLAIVSVAASTAFLLLTRLRPQSQSRARIDP